MHIPSEAQALYSIGTLGRRSPSLHASDWRNGFVDQYPTRRTTAANARTQTDALFSPPKRQRQRRARRQRLGGPH